MHKYRNTLGWLVVVPFLVLVIPHAYADYASSERWFNQKGQSDRMLLQSSLILLGRYGAIADGDFGNYTYRAITAYQTSIGATPDGVLDPAQGEALEEASGQVYWRLGIDLVRDAEGRMAMLLPQSLLSQQAGTKRGTAYFTPDNAIRLETIRKPFSEQPYEALYRTLSSETVGRRITYKHFDDEAFVVSGLRDGRSFYLRILSTPGESVGFSVDWEPEQSELAGMISVFMASHSYPLAFETEEDLTRNEAVAGPATPAPLPKVEKAEKGVAFGSGFFVAEAGVLVTNAHVVQGCSAISVQGYGAARVVTSDYELDLAVLKLEKAVPHPTATIRGSAVELGETVLALGFPLADLLNSSLNVATGIVSSETGLMGESRWFTTNVGLQPGNSGGPILDEHGSVIGVAVAKINDEVLLASTGNIASNVGFAIKGETVADYLSIFRLPDPSPSTAEPLGTKALVELGREFTVQVLCEMS